MVGFVIIKIMCLNLYFLVILDYRKLDSIFFYSIFMLYIMINLSLIKSLNRFIDIVRVVYSFYGVFE